MRLKGRQGRFLAVTIGGWIAARVWLLLPVTPLLSGAAVAPVALPGGMAFPHPIGTPPFEPLLVAREIDTIAIPPAQAAAPRASDPAPAPTRDREYAMTFERPPRLADDAGYESLSFLRAEPSHTDGGHAIEGQAYLFLRPGSGRAALAPGGSLGGSQAAARVAIALNRSGPVRIAVAARLYAPLRAEGAEAAVGLDWHPLAGVPLRLSIERRVGLDRLGRDAWSAYAAGGFYAGRLPLGLEADGYGQAGVVGSRARDLFADGAVRLGRRIAAGAAEAVIGAGTWGAAQPGAARLDIGPRLALSLPVERHRLTLAIEARLRAAGHAAPGSGAAVTLAADF